jgi:hypothetical protein
MQGSDTIVIVPQAEFDKDRADAETWDPCSDIIVITPGPLPAFISADQDQKTAPAAKSLKLNIFGENTMLLLDRTLLIPFFSRIALIYRTELLLIPCRNKLLGMRLTLLITLLLLMNILALINRS